MTNGSMKTIAGEAPKRRLLVSGGAGFLGSHVVYELARRGYQDVFVPRSRDYDLTKLPDVLRAFDDSRPEAVIHLAARVGGIGINQEKPGEFFRDNLLMGVHTMEVARQRGVEKYVSIGTVCAYPKHTPVPFREEDLWNGYPEDNNAPYGLAKKMLLVQGDAYRRQFGFNSIFLLPTNLYGPRDSFDPRRSHVVPALIKKMVEAKEQGAASVSVWGTGTASREFLYVEDAACAIVSALELYDKPEPVNIGSGQEVSIRSLVGLIAGIVGFSGEIAWDASKPDGQPRRCLDTSRAERGFGFRATTPLREGMVRTVEWYLQHRPQGSPTEP